MKENEWQKKYGHEWQDATRKENKDKELGVDWEYERGGEQFEYEKKEVKTHCSPRCPRCQGLLQTVNIHGHEQCVLCHAIVEDCCQGSQLK